MSEDLMLKCLIAFILGWIVCKYMGNGFTIGFPHHYYHQQEDGEHPTPWPMSKNAPCPLSADGTLVSRDIFDCDSDLLTESGCLNCVENFLNSTSGHNAFVADYYNVLKCNLPDNGEALKAFCSRNPNEMAKDRPLTRRLRDKRANDLIRQAKSQQAFALKVLDNEKHGHDPPSPAAKAWLARERRGD